MNDTQTAIDLLPSGESELVFELRGPAYRLMQRIGVIKGAGNLKVTTTSSCITSTVACRLNSLAASKARR
jgi:hypothetical protein